MTITDRDRKILAVLGVLAVLAGYWFLLLSPKRDEVAKVEADVATQQQQRDAALSQVRAAQAAQASFATDYAEMIRLGKAIPSSVDMPSLLVQLDRAANGTHIDVEKITVGARVPASGSAPAGQPATPPADGQQAEGAPDQADTQTSQNARDGSVPVGGGSTGGGAASAAPGSAGSGVPGLDSIPIEFGFTGSYFELADFFHRLKRFVHVGGNGIVVRGRLMTIDSFTFGSSEGAEAGAAAGEGSRRDGRLQATLKATVYLAPKAEGAAAGATPAGPAPAQTPADAASSSSSAPPTAAVQP